MTDKAISPLRQRMSRPALEVADIFRAHGPAWRRPTPAMSASASCERCRRSRPAARRRSVATSRAARTAHTIIGYNSCRNRHCPKCQGAAAKEWLAEREAELLPVPYYHVVFTLPAADRRLRLSEQGGDLRPPVQGLGRDAADDRRRSQASRRPHRHHVGAAHLGLGA